MPRSNSNAELCSCSRQCRDRAYWHASRRRGSYSCWCLASRLFARSCCGYTFAPSKLATSHENLTSLPSAASGLRSAVASYQPAQFGWLHSSRRERTIVRATRILAGELADWIHRPVAALVSRVLGPSCSQHGERITCLAGVALESESIRACRDSERLSLGSRARADPSGKKRTLTQHFVVHSLARSLAH